MTEQPNWKEIEKTDFYILYEDTTGVYPPELLVVQEYDENTFIKYRFALDKCYFNKGDVSDNQYHKDKPAWFGTAERLIEVGKSADLKSRELAALLCSDDSRQRALGYLSIGRYFGYEEFDNYPSIISGEEANKIFDL